MIRGIQTYTGRLVDLAQPKRGDIDILDIAHALSQINRFTGHTRRPYTVAEHSVLVSLVCDDCPLEALLHDASEAYLGDVSSPLKAMLPAYRALEEVWVSAIEERFGLAPMGESVRWADALALHAEFEIVMDEQVRGAIADWPGDDLATKFRWMLQNPAGSGSEYWEEAFLERFRELVWKRVDQGSTGPRHATQSAAVDAAKPVPAMPAPQHHDEIDRAYNLLKAITTGGSTRDFFRAGWEQGAAKAATAKEK